MNVKEWALQTLVRIDGRPFVVRQIRDEQNDTWTRITTLRGDGVRVHFDYHEQVEVEEGIEFGPFIIARFTSVNLGPFEVSDPVSGVTQLYQMLCEETGGVL